MSENGMSPAQFKIEHIKIGDKDITGLYTSMEIFENIFIPVVTGRLTFVDSDGTGFVDENKIEFNEPIDISITSAKGEKYQFKGSINGLAGEATEKDKKGYTIDFTSDEMRNNEQKFITKRYKAKKADEILKEMVEEIEGELGDSNVDTKPMEFISSRWKPLQVVKYVLTHAVTFEASTTDKDSKNQDEQAKGTTGLLMWQVSKDGKNQYRMVSVDELIKGKFESHGPFEVKQANDAASQANPFDAIVNMNFSNVGDIQTKMASGAFRSVNVSFDMDKGAYKEYEYDGAELMTDKQKEIVKTPTRVMVKPFTNERFTNDCSRAQPNSNDQSRESLQANNSRQNTFNDQSGNVTLYPQFKINAGDTIELKINKVKSGSQSKGNENQKHSGLYVVKQVSHHFSSEGRAYTKVKTIRSTTQQDKSTAKG